MIQLYLNGVATFIENNIVIGDEPNFIRVVFGNTSTFIRKIENPDVFEFIGVEKQGFEIKIHHSFLDSEGNYIKPQKCTGTKCKLGSIENIDGSYCIYIKKDTKIEFDGLVEEYIPVYTVFDTFSKKEIELDTSTQDLSFSKQNQLKL